MEEEQNNEQKKKHKPIYIIGAVLFFAGFVMFLSAFIVGLADPMGSFVIGPVLGVVGMLCIVIGSVLGAPLLTKLTTKYNKTIVDYAKEDITDLNTTVADTKIPATKKVVKAVKESLDNDIDGEVKYCTNCGRKLSKDANFCDKCGTEQK